MTVDGFVIHMSHLHRDEEFVGVQVHPTFDAAAAAADKRREHLPNHALTVYALVPPEEAR